MQIELTPSEMVQVYICMARRKADIESLADNPYVSVESKSEHAKELVMMQEIGNKLFPYSSGG